MEFAKITRDILGALDAEFPLSEMGPDFKGKHSITLHDGRLSVAVWTGGKVWLMQPDDEDFAVSPAVLAAAIRRAIAASAPS